MSRPRTWPEPLTGELRGDAQAGRADPCGLAGFKPERSGWLKPENRCLAPATSFCEHLPEKPAIPHWFALGPERPLFAFAGILRPWQGLRGKVDRVHELFAFLTTDANAVVAPIHRKAMPVILTTQEECESWMTTPMLETLCLQRPLPDGFLSVVAIGAKQDG